MVPSICPLLVHLIMFLIFFTIFSVLNEPKKFLLLHVFIEFSINDAFGLIKTITSIRTINVNLRSEEITLTQIKITSIFSLKIESFPKPCQIRVIVT